MCIAAEIAPTHLSAGLVTTWLLAVLHLIDSIPILTNANGLTVGCTTCVCQATHIKPGKQIGK